MKITRDAVDHVALLARLELSDEERELYFGQLNQILEHMDKLRELDTSGVEPTFHVLEEIRNPMREDRAGTCLDPREALANAPEAEAGCFKVPPVIEGD